MARSVHRRLLPLLLAACLLLLLRLEVSDCSSSSAAPSPAEEPREAAAGGAHDAASRHQVPVDAAEARSARVLSMELAEYGRTGSTADGNTPSAAATPVQAEGVVVAPRPPRQTSGGRAMLRPAVLLRSKLARRLLVAAAAGVDAAGTDGAGPSCHSNNVHINCPPASKP